MICGQVLVSQPGFDHVPLSCVPPSTSQDCAGLMATLMNWSVSRFLLTCEIVVGTCERMRLQLARLATPSSGRSFELQRDERSENAPSVRITPPSEPSKIWVGLFGLTTIVCWSGWMPSGAHRHWYGGVTPPFVCSAPSSAHQLAGWFWAS